MGRDIKNCISSQIHDLQKNKNNNNKTRKKIHKSKVIDKKNEKSMLFTKLCVTVFSTSCTILHTHTQTFIHTHRLNECSHLIGFCFDKKLCILFKNKERLDMLVQFVCFKTVYIAS